ncbi:unnamed protein product [Rotaria sordida]|uniref:Uncharacterized protein n=1 Tax=Rotaria sordida TaxID=392033 RepID=A0A813SDN3_9BILA|nr:unnamed protein product [Rotaria sordida]CAF0859511.1 unnamed protein product [Rotaria sordida]CAF0986039.1 unnamed protein product [Rotaria sordida]CAF1060786.1 unnamed protein product [Rotaria sordida]CAF3726980.1 unnamed protein product [Rotaria sordida]
MNANDQNRINVNHLHMREAMAALEQDLTKEAFQALINKKKDSQQNGFMRILTGPSRCCRSYRTQRRLATVVQRSIDIAINDVPMSPINNNMQSYNYQKIKARTLESKQSTSLLPTSSEFKRLASHCYIHDYAVWLERQQELIIWLNLAKLLKLPIEESKIMQEELEQFRLQYECLRVIERLPLSVGPG